MGQVLNIFLNCKRDIWFDSLGQESILQLFWGKMFYLSYVQWCLSARFPFRCSSHDISLGERFWFHFPLNQFKCSPMSHRRKTLVKQRLNKPDSIKKTVPDLKLSSFLRLWSTWIHLTRICVLDYEMFHS